MSSNLGNVYRSKHWAKRWARGRPIRKVPGGWKICRYSKKRRRKASRPGRRRLNNKRTWAPSMKGKIKPLFIIEF